MRFYDKADLRRWYKQIWEMTPDSDSSERDVRFELAFGLASFNKNYLTAAHLILDESWNDDKARPALLELSSRIQAWFFAEDTMPTVSTFEQQFANDFNSRGESQ